jgi:hypothetical protein
MSDLPTKKQMLGELRDKLEHLEIQLQRQEQIQSNLNADWAGYGKRNGIPKRTQLDQNLNVSIADLNAEIKALREVMYEAWQPTFPKRPSFYQRLKTKLSSKKRGRSQSCSQ